MFFPHVGKVRIEGPFNAAASSDTPSRRKILACRPTSEKDEEPCARQTLSALARRAYRRPVTPSDVGTLMEFYSLGRKGGTFEQGIEMALQRLLVDTEFVYRAESEPANLAPGTRYRISDVELASRLSFFLWSSIPDDELMNLAVQGRLRNPVVLEQQVKRMLADPRSEALVSNFTGQWLNVRAIRDVAPIATLYPDFDDSLRAAFQREVELFFASIVREDRSVLDLLTADYTFVDERLALHYGIPNVYGSQFRRVTLGPEHDARRGLLGKGALLTVTSQPARTSPVARGKWFLQTFLGVSPPDPPPNVPPVKPRPEDAAGNKKVPTMRQQMEEHRANPVCASCHKIFEPIGLSLENFDAVGMWRTEDEGSADRFVRHSRRRHDDNRRGQFARPAGALFGSVRAGGDREDADVRAGPRSRVSRYAAGSIHCARRGCEQLSVLVVGDGHREERAVPDEYEAWTRNRRLTHSTGGSLSKERSCFLRESTSPAARSCAARVSTLALPLLDSMVPAGTLLAQTAATPTLRFAGIFVPHGMAPGTTSPTKRAPASSFR